MSVQESPAKRGFGLVEMRFGNPVQSIKITDANEDMVSDRGKFSAMPKMEITVPENTGGLESKEAFIDLPLDSLITAFTMNITSGCPHPPITCVISTLIENPTGLDLTTDFVGVASRVVENPKGKVNTNRLYIADEIALLNRKLGIPVLNTCTWTFGGPGCRGNVVDPGIQLLVQTHPGTIVSIDRHMITIAGLPAKNPAFWQRGHVERNDLRILIADYRSGDTFVLEQPAPTISTSGSIGWQVGDAIDVIGGCNKLEGTCAGIHDNVSHNGATGSKALLHNPIFERPPS